jgi:hypothetical protein
MSPVPFPLKTMQPRSSRLPVWALLLALVWVAPGASRAAVVDDAALPAAPAAQPSRLSGAIVNPSGLPVAHASVMLRSGNGASTQLQTDESGTYTAADLPAGEYQLTIAAPGFAPEGTSVTLGAGSEKTLNLTLTADLQETSAAAPVPKPPQQGTPPSSGTKAPSGGTQSPSGGTQAPSSSNAPSLSDLGLAPSETRSNPAEQARLDKRTHMLKVHQKLGLITAIPMAATLVSSGGAKKHHGTAATTPGTTTGMDVHAALGGVTVGMYAATAYYAIAAPKIPGTQTRGAIRLHKALVWIHGPGMVLTPILGAMAYQQENDGQKIHGIASAHAVVAWTTVLAYGASIVSVSWPIKLPF